MISLKLPLEVTRTGLERQENTVLSINAFIELLLHSIQGESAADTDFGFLLNSMKFENFNESEGVVFGRTGPLGKKVSGTSRNLNTFASELCSVIKKYEPRLKDVSASMTYARVERVIYVNVKGVIVETEEDYQYDTIIKIWR